MRSKYFALILAIAIIVFCGSALADVLPTNTSGSAGNYIARGATDTCESHTEVSDEGKAPTCTETGLTAGSHCSVCGEVIVPQKVIPMLYHKWTDYMALDSETHFRVCERCETFDGETEHEWVDLAEEYATCTQNGNRYVLCVVCEYEDVLEIPALGHMWGDVSPIDYSAHARACIQCGKYDSSEPHIWGEVKPVDAETHAFSCESCGMAISDMHNWIFIAEDFATCTENGYVHMMCSECEADNITEISMLGHMWGDVTPVDSDTHARICDRCGAIDGKAPHNWEDAAPVDSQSHSVTCDGCGMSVNDAHNWVVIAEDFASCTKDGCVYIICSVCEMEDPQTIPALGHIWGDIAPVDFNTHARVCERCGVTDKEEAHNWGDVVPVDTQSHSYSCADCGMAVSDGHDWAVIVAENATCTENGYNLMLCTVCDMENTESIPALGHDWIIVGAAVAPTCTQSGYESFMCSVCETQKTVAVPALGHDWINFGAGQDPTCTQSGYEFFMCSVCEMQKTVEVPALEHDWGADVTANPENHTFTCNRCGAVKAELHNWVNDGIGKDPTCTQSGYRYVMCSICDLYNTVAVPALGHAWNTISASDSQNHTFTCDRCGAAESAPHNWSDSGAVVDPTCTQNGYKSVMCSVCYAEDTVDIPAIGHQYSISDKHYESFVGDRILATLHFNCGHALEASVTITSDNTDIVKFIETDSNNSDSETFVAIFEGVSAGLTTVNFSFSDGVTKNCSSTVIVHSTSPLRLPSMLRTIDSEAFMNSKVQEVILPGNLEYIGSRAFAVCSELRLVSMPDSVVSIADDAFKGSPNVAFICASNNAAAAYAEAHNIPYYIEGTTAQPTVTPAPTAAPTLTPTQVPTAAPTPTVTPIPTADPIPTPTPKPTAAPTPAITPVPTATPAPTATPDPEDSELTEFERYQNMSAEEQEAFFNSFASPAEFFEWYNAAQKEYEDKKNSIEIDGSGNIDLGGIGN